MVRALTAPPTSGQLTGADPKRELLTVLGVCKRFGITQALDGVSVAMYAGEVHALMGENGAGKSTLGKAIAGLHKPDSGSISVGGRSLALGSIQDATAAGIRIVHQELAQCPNLSVAENLCLHDLPTSMGMIDRDRMNRRASRLLAKLAPEIDVQAPLGTLAPGRRQIVQIASSLDDESGTPRIIIFDEPTSSLSIAEAERLMQIVRSLAAEGLLCIYVSHRMNEIFSCCDRITVLRDGKFVATSVIKEVSEAAVVSQMIGRTLDSSGSRRAAHAKAAAATAPTALEIRNMSSPGKLTDVSLSVRSGEILGIGGLVGAGRSELLDALFGLDRRATGEVRIGGSPLEPGNPRAAIAAGLGYVPEDRRLQGLFFDMGVDENIALPFMPLLAKLGVRAAAAEKADVLSRIRRLQVKTATLQSRPGELSGGNQQKLLLARWMDERTKVLLLDEPTRGIDVGTKAEIYKLVWQAADAGMAVVLVSSEMPELLLLSDRIVVLCEGEMTGELAGPAMTQENILNLATAKHRSAG